MARKQNRKNKPSRKPQPRSFSRTLVWALALALVFSIGLIAGQRMLDREAMPPLVALSSATAHAVQPSPGEPQAAGEDEVEFSFYERLGTAKPASASKEVGEQLDEAMKAQDAQALPARYTLQLGAHSTLEQARKQVVDLEKKGLEAHLVTTKEADSGKGKVYRVRVGKFHSMDEARQFQGALKSQRQLDTFLMPL